MYEIMSTFGTSFTIPLLMVTFCLLAWISTRRPARIPPGPPLTPIIGNLLLIYNSDQQKVFRNLRKKYGDMFTFYIGSNLVVVLNGYDLIKDAFVKNADIFSDRPPGVRIMDGKTRGIVATSGSLWKQHRKFALVTLRDFGFGKFSLEETIQNEITIFLKAIAEKETDSFDIKSILNTSVSNIICSIAFGKRFQYNDPIFTDLMETFENVIQTNIGLFFSMFKFLEYLPGDIFGKKMEIASVERYKQFAKTVYQEHLDTYDNTNIRDYIDAFIHEMELEENKNDSTFKESQLYGEIMDLFQAGTETTSTTIRWALLYLITYPDVQNKMRSEIDDVVGMERLPSLQDKPNLPYSEAIIMEVLRIANIIPAAVPHYTSKDTTLNGFHIPESTMVIANIDSVLFDPAVWKNPEEFHPERFINENGSVEKPKEFIPFSIGRRVCLGESLARMELFLFLTAMVQRFFFLCPPNGSLPSMEGVTGIVHSPHPYKICVRTRDSAK